VERIAMEAKYLSVCQLVEDTREASVPGQPWCLHMSWTSTVWSN